MTKPWDVADSNERGWDVGASNNRENTYWSQVHFPQFWVCTRCDITKDDPRAKQACVAQGESPWHEWKRT